MTWAEPLYSPDLGDGARLQRALLIALLLHVVVIFAIGFRAEIPPRSSLPTLDLILVEDKPRGETPDEAEALAERDTVAQPEADDLLDSPPVAVAAPQRPDPVPTPPQAERQPEPQPAPTPTPPAAATPKPADPVLTRKPRELPSAATLMSRSLAMAELSADVDATVDAYAALPRQRHISASTQEFRYAQYMQAWVAKVERVGNLNYPEAARRANLQGRLILDVALGPDGAIKTIEFVKSSGFQELDDAAVRIVRMAEPFAPFPPDIRDETDILHITRTWEFTAGHRLSGR